MRVLHVVRQYAPSVGGLEAYVRNLAHRQAGRHDVEILTLNRLFGSATLLPASEDVDGIRVRRIPYRGWRELFLSALPVRRLGRFDIVHVHATDQLLDLISLASRIDRGPPYVVTTHGLYFHTQKLARVKWLYLKAVTRFSLKASEAVFAVSENDARIVRSVGVEPILLYNPVEPIGTFVAGGKDLLYLGRIAPNKEIGRLLAFVAALASRDPTIRLHLVGGDPDGLWSNISTPHVSLIAAGTVTYHGYLAMEALRDLARRCGFVVSASNYEGYGMSMVEGMSVGLLPAMHDNAAFREIQGRSGLGLICDFSQPYISARSFETWRSSATLAMREEAARFARSRSWDAAVDVVESEYERALKRASSASR